MRLLMALLLAGIAGCSATATDDPTDTGADAITSTDSADPVLFTLDNVKTIELTLAPADMQMVSDQANGVAAQRISVWDERPKIKGTLQYKGPPVPVTPT